jgi:hypothetical protein
VGRAARISSASSDPIAPRAPAATPPSTAAEAWKEEGREGSGPARHDEPLGARRTVPALTPLRSECAGGESLTWSLAFGGK